MIAMPNERGSGAKVLEILKSAGVNLIGIVGYEMGPTQAALHVVADAPERACAAIQAAGLTCQSVESIAVELANEPGSCAGMLRALADAGIDVDHCYATTNGSGAALCVLRTKDNAKALSVLQS
jgi:hypothetical protein